MAKEKEGPAKSPDEYALTLSGGGININTVVDARVARQIVNLAMGAPAGTPALNAPPSPPSPPGSPASAVGKGAFQSMTPKEFMVAKAPTTDVERVACLAYYQTNIRNGQTFKTEDLTALNREAAQSPISNPTRAVANATSQNAYLAPAGEGSKQITAKGEAVVEALPDRNAVAAAIDAHPARRRRKKSKKKKAKVKT